MLTPSANRCRLILEILICGLMLTVATQAPAAEPLTNVPWREATISVTDLDRTAEFFLDVAGYEARWRGAVGALVQWIEDVSP